MKLLMSSLLALVPVSVIAQESVVRLGASPLSLESSTVEIVTTVETVERTNVSYEGRLLEGSSRVIGERSKQRLATIVKSSSPPVAVHAYTPDFVSVDLIAVSETEFLLDAKPGRYLLVFDTETGAKIRPVVVESSGPDTEAISALVTKLVSDLNDTETAGAISVALSRLSFDGDSVESAKNKVQTEIKQVLLNRSRASARKDWLNGFRRPLSQAIDRLEIESVEDYALVIQAIAESLNTKTMSSTQSSVTTSSVAEVGQALKPLSANFPPAWEPPEGPSFVGQVHNGRQLTSICEGSTCRLVWRYVGASETSIFDGLEE